MKRFFVILFSLVFIFSLSVSSIATVPSESIDVYRNSIKLKVNGKKVDVDNFLFNGTTYIPLREVSELLDKYVGWNTYTKVASIDDANYEIQELSKLLPDSKGFQWNYNGFAEYDHIMKLDNIVKGNEKRDYIISGAVGDPSGGESTLDRNLSIKYTIIENKIIQEKTETTMLDSKFDKITLIQTPLVAGTFWKEVLVDKEGTNTTINAYIQKVEIKHGGKKEYTIRYDDVNSKYYEVRTIQEGLGVVNFEKLLELKDSSFPVSYFLYTGEIIDEIEVKLYFPDKMGEKLNLEKRKVEVVGKAVGRASVNALIKGSETNLSPSLPLGTKLLNIYIQNKTAFVDFSHEFITNHSGGSTGELMTLYSLVNTLTEYNSIDRVQILVEGEKGKSLGNIILDKALKRDIKLIK